MAELSLEGGSEGRLKEKKKSSRELLRVRYARQVIG